MEEVLLLLVISCIGAVHSGIPLTTYTDLSAGREFSSSSTCGQLAPEEFPGGGFPVGGANNDPSPSPLVCDASDPAKSFPPGHLSDEDGGTVVPERDRTFWLSEFGAEDVSLSLNLGGFYFLRSVTISFLSPIPSAFVVEVSQDLGGTYHPLRYYSEDCFVDFDLPDMLLGGSSGPKPDELVCTSDFNSGLEESLVYAPLLGSEDLDPQDFLPTLSFTNLRLRLLRFGSAQPPVLYHAAYDVEVEGACLCNGNIAFPEVLADNTLQCPCNPSPDPPFTCPSTLTGPLCRSCAPGFFPAPSGSEEACLPCNCDPAGTENKGDSPLSCDLHGQCDCLPGVGGQRCNMCPQGYLGPSEHTHLPCVKCFCNGFVDSSGCVSAGGWYQAQVRNQFESEEEGAGFTSPGSVTYGPGGFLEVLSAPSSAIVVLSFPPSYLGDKRTAFGQGLSFTFDLPMLPEEIMRSEVRVQLEVTSFVSSVDPPLVLEFGVKLDDTSSTEFLQTQVVFSAAQSEVFRVPYFQRRRPARDRDIRMALANIRYLRLKLTFPKDVEFSHRILRLYNSSMDFATDDVTTPTSPALLPLQEVNYVESCSCPMSRTGSVCQGCSEGYTWDPSFGGEFARCVRCFCNFHSMSCDPVSGMCFNCLANTGGERCETCEDGFDRMFPISFFPCDRCALGFFDAQNGSCVPCQCNPQGSLSPVCDIATGECTCQAGVAGLTCNRCLNTSLGTFPNCDLCDECSDQWRDRINALSMEILNTTAIVANLSMTNQTATLDIPNYRELLDLVRAIEEFLASSNIEMLTIEISATHNFVWSVLNRTDMLQMRAIRLKQQLIEAENVSSVLLGSFSNLTATISNLRQELANISAIFSAVDVPMDSSQLLQQSRLALERADSARELVQVNFTSALNETKVTLENFESLDADSVEQRNTALQIRISDIWDRVDRIQSFLNRASRQLCRNGIGTERGSGSGDEIVDREGSGFGSAGNFLFQLSCADECGGIGCGTCGIGEGCGGLASDAQQALDISERALEMANSLLSEVRSHVADLTDLLERVQTAADTSQSFEDTAMQIRDNAMVLDSNIESFLALLTAELGMTRISADEIGDNVNDTLELRLNLLPSEFFELLEKINATIDMFFIMNLTEVDLRQRAIAALNTALEVNARADNISSQNLMLQDQLNSINSQIDNANSGATRTRGLLTLTNDNLDSSLGLLEASRGRVNTSQASLIDLRMRLEQLEGQIQQNEAGIVVARTLTSEASQAASETEVAGAEVLASFEKLESAVNARLNQSQQDLEDSLDVRNRSCRLQETTQQQLLRVENLVRVERALVTQQEEIRADIERVANEIEVLEAETRTHITRNTICLVRPEGNKRRRRRRRRSS